MGGLGIQVQNSANAAVVSSNPYTKPEIISPGIQKQKGFGDKSQKQQHDDDFYNQKGMQNQYIDHEQNMDREDEEMDLEPINSGANPNVNTPFSYSKIQNMLKSHKWSQRA